MACIFRIFRFLVQGLFFYFQILLHPLGRGHVVFFLEGRVEDGLALESGSLRDALDGSGQVCSPSKQRDGIGHTQFIPKSWEGGNQFLIEAVAHADSRNIDCQRDVMQGEFEVDVGLLGIDVGQDAFQIR